MVIIWLLFRLLIHFIELVASCLVPLGATLIEKLPGLLQIFINSKAQQVVDSEIGTSLIVASIASLRE
jgi:hypothetical protein